MNVEPRVYEGRRRLSQSSDIPADLPQAFLEPSHLDAYKAIAELLEAIKDSEPNNEKKVSRDKASKRFKKSSKKNSRKSSGEQSSHRRSTLKPAKSMDDLLCNNNKGSDPPGVKSSDLKHSKPHKSERTKGLAAAGSSRTRSSSPRRRSPSPRRRKHKKKKAVTKSKSTSQEDALQMSWLRRENSFTATEKDYVKARDIPSNRMQLTKKASRHGRLSRSMDDEGFAWFESPGQQQNDLPLPTMIRKTIIPFKEIDLTSTTTSTTKSGAEHFENEHPRGSSRDPMEKARPRALRSVSMMILQPSNSEAALRRGSPATTQMMDSTAQPRRLARTKLEMVKIPTKRTRRSSLIPPAAGGFECINSKLVHLETSQHNTEASPDGHKGTCYAVNAARHYPAEPLDFSEFENEEFSTSEVELSPSRPIAILSPRKVSRSKSSNKMIQAAKSVGDDCWFPSI